MCQDYGDAGLGNMDSATATRSPVGGLRRSPRGPSRHPRPRRLAQRLFVGLLAALLATAGHSLVAPSPASAAPTITITDPAPGTVADAGSRFRLGWKEKPSTASLPITKRTVAQYAATSGNCSSASYALAWTNTTANRPFRYPLTGLATGHCYYWKVTLTDIGGYSVTAKSGYVRRTAADPNIDVSFPVPGAFTDAPPADYTLDWGEASSAGVTARAVTEESATMASGRTCVGVAWSTARTFNPPDSSVALTALTSGHCYRYTIDITDKGGATASAQSGPLLVANGPPPCAYGDIATTVTDYASWKVSLLDTTYKFSSSYAPGDLVATSGITSMSSGFLVRSLAKTDLKAMADAARAAGATLNIQSSYRSYSTQSTTFNDWVAKSGMYAALLASARPGHSEHQLGTAIDFKSYGGIEPWKYSDWATTKAGAWMAANAYKYGWLMTYPKAVSPFVTCYQYEPWHYRYYGRTLAKTIHDSGITTREYLWRHGSLAPGA
jgi:D-alanyl-D-alanine carboxypeptidase